MSEVIEVKAGNIKIGGHNPLVLIAGPCVIEDEKSTLALAEKIKEIAVEAGIPFVFKASYDKANRTSIDSFRGPGLDEGLKILARVKNDIGVPVISDVHQIEEIEPAAEVLDILQIPAFLCRQTDLLVSAARTGKTVNVKKGQFLAPGDMRSVVGKLKSAGNPNIILTERGSSFGYNNLVVDMRSLIVMRDMGVPVVFDATHSVQLPGGRGNVSGGERRFVEPLSRAAAVVGIDGLFLEVHESPEDALCDGPNSIALSDLSMLLSQVVDISQKVKSLND
jgi:2-dehydro-3-deoxyphosphooctonate aldolase (KDO 8-P synthase)